MVRPDFLLVLLWQLVYDALFVSARTGAPDHSGYRATGRRSGYGRRFSLVRLLAARVHLFAVVFDRLCAGSHPTQPDRGRGGPFARQCRSRLRHVGIRSTNYRSAGRARHGEREYLVTYLGDHVYRRRRAGRGGRLVCDTRTLAPTFPSRDTVS